ncbi:MAG: beta strand repeat-containing protein, partial [Gammaproteobacteria bacterium]
SATVTFDITTGILTFNGSLQGVSVTGNNSNHILISGNLTDINVALNGMLFKPNINYFGQANLSITTNDNGSTGSGGPLITTSNIPITINQLNIQPTLNNLGTISANTYIEGGSPVFVNNNLQFNISDFQLNLLNNGLGNYSGSNITIMRLGGANSQDFFYFNNLSSIGVTVNNNNLIYNNNIIANFNNVSGKLEIDFTSNYGSIVTYSLANSIIKSVQYSYNPTSLDPPANVKLYYAFNDGLGASNSIISSNITLNINQVNNAPQAAVPPSQTLNQHANLVFSASNNNVISISDVDAEGTNETVVLSISHGILSLINTAGATVTGNNTGNMSITGSINNINNVLNGLIFIPDHIFNGSTNLFITVNDNGNTGTNGSLQSSYIVGVYVNPVNIPTVINNLGNVSNNTYIEGANPVYINNNSYFTVANLELDSLNNKLGNYNGASITISRAGGGNSLDLFSFGSMPDVSVSGGNLISGGRVIANFTNNNGILQISFISTNGVIATTALTNEIIRGIQYSYANNDPPSNVMLNYVFNDGINVSNSIVNSNIQINILAIDTPVVHNYPALQSINENHSLTFSTTNNNAISISDVDLNNGNITITLTIANGILQFSGVNNLTNVINNSSTITATGNINDLNIALNGLVFNPNPNFYGNINLSITSNDNGNSGFGGPLVTNSNVIINVNQVNLQPTINNLGTIAGNHYLESGSSIFIN